MFAGLSNVLVWERIGLYSVQMILFISLVLGIVNCIDAARAASVVYYKASID